MWQPDRWGRKDGEPGHSAAGKPSGSERPVRRAPCHPGAFLVVWLEEGILPSRIGMRLTVGAVYFYVIIFIFFYLFQLSGDQQFEGGFLLGHVSFDEVDSWFSVVLCHEFF